MAIVPNIDIGLHNGIGCDVAVSGHVSRSIMVLATGGVIFF